MMTVVYLVGGVEGDVVWIEVMSCGQKLMHYDKNAGFHLKADRFTNVSLWRMYSTLE